MLTRPATALVRLVAAREVSATDLVRAHLERITANSHTLNAFVDLSAEQALEEAVRQDEAAARGSRTGALGPSRVIVSPAGPSTMSSC